ncbi:hypothetical protein FSARC_13539 [Fusarium sarcochroum]|uniref:F-box domain-containing protein n=1 Tax=Fusarium sarcochroum TaxID=1208366 RepID=A0A8H4WSK2_9HYPO|nr:hypothetical protein FSARC_13539 [Fusarium sarcochroum]
MATPENTEAILRTCSYHRRTFYEPLAKNDLSKIPKSLSQSCDSTASNPGILPTELMAMVALNLDIVSLLQARQASRCFRAVATELLEYKRIMQHGLRGVDALLRTGLGSEFSVKDLHAALIRPDCELCGEFGGLLFLPCCTRCCYNCLKNAPETAVLDRSQTIDRYPLEVLGNRGAHTYLIKKALESTKIRSLMTYKSKKRTDGFWDEYYYQFGVLASDLFKAYRKCGELNEKATRKLEKGCFDLRSKSCIAYPWLNLETTTIEHGVPEAFPEDVNF